MTLYGYDVKLVHVLANASAHRANFHIAPEHFVIVSQLKSCLEAANHFLLSQDDARTILAHLTETIEQHWDTVCDEAEISGIDKKLLWGRQFLNPYSTLTE